MDSNEKLESVKLWEKNAQAWIKLTSEGKDLYRDFVGTPGFISVLPNVKDLTGLDIACGHGYHTRMLAQFGANMTGVDLCENFLKYAIAQEKNDNFGIVYEYADANNLFYKSSSFDFAICYASLFDIENFKMTIKEAYRVIKPNGFFQILIPHPCFWKPDLEWVYNEEGKKTSAVIKNYYKNKRQTAEWMFEGFETEEQSFLSPQFNRTLSEWINAFSQANFFIDFLNEPRCEDQSALKEFPLLEGANIIPIYLIIRAKKQN